MQLLDAVEKCRISVSKSHFNTSPAVILTGDLNACPDEKSSQFGFDCTVYNLIKEHSLGLRSVLNDDWLAFEMSKGNSPEVWTTWKARNKKGKEVVVKHCIDYILYAPLRSFTRSADTAGDFNSIADKIRNLGVQASAVLRSFKDEEIDPELFPSQSYPSDHISVVADLQIIEKFFNKAS